MEAGPGRRRRRPRPPRACARRSSCALSTIFLRGHAAPPCRRPPGCGCRRCRSRTPGPSAVSPWRISIARTARPSVSATICANVVSWPWPCEWVPDVDGHRAGRVDRAPGPIRPARCRRWRGAVAALGPKPQISIQVERPMPRYRPFLRSSACRLRSVVVADDLERLVERLLVVARVVRPGRSSA